MNKNLKVLRGPRPSYVVAEARKLGMVSTVELTAQVEARTKVEAALELLRGIDTNLLGPIVHVDDRRAIEHEYFDLRRTLSRWHRYLTDKVREKV